MQDINIIYYTLILLVKTHLINNCTLFTVKFLPLSIKCIVYMINKSSSFKSQIVLADYFWCNFVLPSAESYPTPLIHCSTDLRSILKNHINGQLHCWTNCGLLTIQPGIYVYHGRVPKLYIHDIDKYIDKYQLQGKVQNHKGKTKQGEYKIIANEILKQINYTSMLKLTNLQIQKEFQSSYLHCSHHLEYVYFVVYFYLL